MLLQALSVIMNIFLPMLNIEKTTNRIEGLFKELKDKLRPHSGLTRKHKILFIQDFLNKKSW